MAHVTNKLLRSEPIRELVDMHAYRRPAYSETETAFSSKYITTLPGVYQDKAGNWIGCISDRGEPPAVLWSSHTDTVHKTAGMQKLALDSVQNHLFLSSKETVRECLGADCTVGVWLMRRMFLEGIPGLYIWHACEESGGYGSDYIATKQRDLLDGIQAAIAFDRRGYTSVITHQFGERTASDDFARSLASMLGKGFSPDSGGTFTDTANYASIVPECTNISVGYHNAHQDSEWLDLDHAAMMLHTMLCFKPSALRISRDPATYGRDYWADDPVWARGVAYPSIGKSGRNSTPAGEIDEQHEIDAIAALIYNREDEVAELLVELGYTYNDVKDWLR